ncbi:MAG: hypothetical protein QG635_373 [Bacteroidota bacterium]|nr:hypothetical protein [Bacteroidota bacterium]
MSEFNELLEKVEAMPLDSKEIFADILFKNISESKRTQIRQDIIQGRKEYQAGKTRSGDVKDLMKEILK